MPKKESEEEKERKRQQKKERALQLESLVEEARVAEVSSCVATFLVVELSLLFACLGLDRNWKPRNEQTKRKLMQKQKCEELRIHV